MKTITSLVELPLSSWETLHSLGDSSLDIHRGLCTASSLSLSLSHTHTLSHTHAHTLSLTHTLSLSHTHTHTHTSTRETRLWSGSLSMCSQTQNASAYKRPNFKNHNSFIPLCNFFCFFLLILIQNTHTIFFFQRFYFRQSQYFKTPSWATKTLICWQIIQKRLIKNNCTVYQQKQLRWHLKRNGREANRHAHTQRWKWRSYLTILHVPASLVRRDGTTHEIHIII